MYSCFDIAHKFLTLAEKDGTPVGTMKLLKLTYIAYGIYLGFSNRKLFRDRIEAWQYGPVIPNLYHVIKRFGKGDVDIDTINLYQENNLSDIDSTNITMIWEKYKHFSGLDLSSLTHQEGTPWDKTYHSSGFNTPIPDPIIQEYYSELLAPKS